MRGIERRAASGSERPCARRTGRSQARSAVAQIAPARASSTPWRRELGQELARAERRAAARLPSAAPQATISASCSAGVRPSGRAAQRWTRSCWLQAADPLHEELVEVAAEDGEELQPLEQRHRSDPRASASTRRLNSSQESSRLRSCSDGSSSFAAAGSMARGARRRGRGDRVMSGSWRSGSKRGANPILECPPRPRAAVHSIVTNGRSRRHCLRRLPARAGTPAGRRRRSSETMLAASDT